MNSTNSQPHAAVAAHTPTPWHNDITSRPLGGGWIYDEPNGNIIATTFTLHIGEETASANAAFIVRACNSHAALVEALDTLVFAASRGEYVATALEQARAALAAAKQS